MEFEGKPVSERFWLNGVCSSQFASKAHPERRFMQLSTPCGDFVMRCYPDINPEPFVGHSVTVGVRLMYPTGKPHPEYGRTYLVDSIQDANNL